MNRTEIYAITNIDQDSTVVYIGKTKNKIRRERIHKYNFGKQIEFTIIDQVESIRREDWGPLESYWIEQFKQWGFKLANKNKGGGGPEHHPKEVRAKMGRKGIKKPGVSNALKGRVFPEETIEKFRKAATGNKNALGAVRSEEFKANLRKPKSEEFKQKLRDYYRQKKQELI